MNATIVKIEKLHDDVIMPSHATTGSACFDIHAYIRDDIPITVYGMENLKGSASPSDDAFELLPGDRALIPTGLIFDIPEHHSVRIHPRSSISLKKGLIIPNGEGIIDSDYYHESFVILYNSSGCAVRIENGDREISRGNWC